MSHHTTLVTALYDIGRDKLSGKNAYRSFDDYLDRFKYVLSINVPIVVYIPNNLVEYVQKHRPTNYTTKVIIREFKQLAAYYYYDRIQQTIDNMNKQPNAPNYFKECPEFITASYETIIFSKFDFLKEVANDNPFNSQYFIWLDAGTFYDAPPFNVKLSWPEHHKIKLLGDKFLVSNYNFDITNKQPLKDIKRYLTYNRNEICAYILGGNVTAINRVHQQFWNLVNNALNMGVINNEQHFLQLMALDKPEWYYLWYRTRYHYNNLPVPLRDRMIPAELAQGTYIGEHYPVNNQIKVLAVATKNLPSTKYQRWENSAKHYGYNYEILGRNTEWKGFNTKIKLCHERLLNVIEPYTIISDCTDVFFCASADEFYNKIISMPRDIMIGGELELYYVLNKGGKYTHEELTKEYTKRAQSCFVYPNGGFIFGKTSALLKLMSYILNYQDDQVAYIDCIYQNLFSMSIDYNTTIIGNVPNYRDRTPVKSFVYDKTLNRYYNRDSGEYPVAFHFPGGNWPVMQEYYTTSQNDLYTPIAEGTSTNTGYIFVAVIIVLLIILLLIMYSKR